jgi:hypothetical protein
MSRELSTSLVGSTAVFFSNEIEFDVLQETLCDANESITGPGMKLINHSAVDEAWESTSPDPERISDGRKSQDDAKILLNARHEVAEPSLGCVDDALRLGARCN